jgi:hypothetical protein
MDAESKLAKIREQNRKRQAKYLEKSINAKKHAEANKKSYEKRMLKKKEQKEKPAQSTFTQAEMKAELDRYVKMLKAQEKIEVKEPIEEEFIILRKKKPIKQNPISIEHIKEKMIELIPNKNSAMTWIYAVQRIMKSFNETDFVKLINRKDLIEKLNSTDFKANTRQTNYAGILKVIDTLDVKLASATKKKIVNAFQSSKIKAHEYAAEPKEDIVTFDEYVKKIEDTFGVDSKEYLITSIYKEVPVRDDLQLKIVNSIKETSDKDTNYLVLTQSPKGRIIINRFKSEEKHEPADVILSTSLTNKIKKFVNAKKDKTYLFSDKLLSTFVSKMNKAIGLKGGISLFRHMIVEDFLKTARTPEERVEMAAKMKHSPVAQLHYLRNKKE